MGTSAAGQFRVLVVDDDASYARFLREVFEQHNADRNHYGVVVADCVSRARELLKSGGWSLILIDQYLGDEKGLDLVREVVAHYPELPVAMMSNENDLLLNPEDIACFATGKVLYFQKSELSWEKLNEELHGALPRVYRVLIVDDDEDDRFYQASCIESGGLIRFDVDQAEDLQQATELVRTSDYDVVLLDYRLNGAKGTELLPAIRASNPQTRVVLCTHFTTSNVLDEVAVSEIANGKLFYMDKLNIDRESLMDELSVQLGL